MQWYSHFFLTFSHFFKNSAYHSLVDFMISRSTDDIEARYKQTKELHILSSCINKENSKKILNHQQVLKQYFHGIVIILFKYVESHVVAKVSSQLIELEYSKMIQYYQKVLHEFLRNFQESFLTYEGDNFVLLSQTCRQLVYDYQQGISKKKFPDRLSYLNNPIEFEENRRKFLENSNMNFRDEKFQMFMFQWRENYLIKRVLRRNYVPLYNYNINKDRQGLIDLY